MREIDNLREHLKTVAVAIDSASNGGKLELARHHAADLNVSTQTLYRMLQREVGWTSGRKPRRDKGVSAVPTESLEFAAALQKTGRRRNGKLVMNRPLAKALTQQAGYVADVSVSHFGRLLRTRGLDADMMAQPTPHVELRSDPGELMQVDPSLCLIYYMRGQQHIVREDVFYKNKLDNIAKVKLKVWRYVAVDHASHYIFVRYFEQAGESQHALFRFLMHCWLRQEGRPAHGVPKHLMMDPGSANTAHAIKNLCKSLEVNLIINKPGQPRAKGGVEVAQNIVERSFEALLKVQPVESVDALNEAVDAWCNGYNSNRLPNLDTRLHRAGLAVPVSRTDLWMLIDAATIRICPPMPVCSELMRGATVERNVGSNLCVRYRHPAAPATRTYDLRNILQLRAGETVTVRPLIYGDETVMIEFTHYDGTAYAYRIDPVRDYDAMGRRLDAPRVGEYHSLPMHEAERTQQRLDVMAYGIDGDGVMRDREAIEKAKDDAKAKPFAHLNDGLGLRPLDALKGIEMPTYMPRKGVALKINAPEERPLESTGLEKDGTALCMPSPAQLPEETTRLTHVAMARWLKRELGDEWNTQRYTQMVAAYPHGVTYEDMAAVVEKFKRDAGLSGLRAVK